MLTIDLAPLWSCEGNERFRAAKLAGLSSDTEQKIESAMMTVIEVAINHVKICILSDKKS